MKALPLINMSDADIAQVEKAMKNYLLNPKLKESDKRLFLLDYQRVVENKQNAELDGLGMRQIAKALKRRSNLLYALGTGARHERKRVVNLAFDIDYSRIMFQMDFWTKKRNDNCGYS